MADIENVKKTRFVKSFFSNVFEILTESHFWLKIKIYKATLSN